MKNVLLKNKNVIKYSTIQDEDYKIKILGIGPKAIKYSINDGEDEFAFHDSAQGYKLGKLILKSFDNEYWNEDIKERIKAQSELCKKDNFPMFAPQDGFCWSCGKQIFTERNDWRARNEHITGCPECHRSYCD